MTVKANVPTRSIELFSGAGGLGLGLAAAGFQHGIVCDKDPDACDTIRLNQRHDHPLVRGWEVHQCDARSIDLSAVPAGVALLAAGVPCQPFSKGGKQLGPRDPRDMWPTTIAALRTLQPKVAVFENVKAMATKFATYLDYVVHQIAMPEIVMRPSDDGSMDAHHRRLADHFQHGRTTGLGYRVAYALLDSADFGVPQRRERVYVVAYRSDVEATWTAPEATHSADALFRDQFVNGSYWVRHGLDRPAATGSDLIRLRRSNAETPDMFGAPGRHLAHQTVRDAIADLGEPTAREHPSLTGHLRPDREARSYKGHTGSPVDRPAKTLRAGDHGVSGGENMLVDDGRCRHFTVREAARLQGFPDDYRFSGGWSSGLQQLGNAVSVPVSRLIGDQVHASLANA